MLRKANNKFFAAIGDNSLTSALPSAGTVVTAANLPNGAIVVTDLGLRRLDDSTAGADLSAMGTDEQFMIVQGLGASKPLLKSEPITIGKTKITYKKHVINRQQVSTIGYNGSTGSLPSANSTSYYIKLRKNDNDAGNRTQPMSLSAQFKTSASATQEELAFGLTSVFKKSITDLEPANGYVKAEVIGDGTVAAHTGSSVISKFTKGSKEVSVYIKTADATSGFTASTLTIADNAIVNVPSSGATSFSFEAVALGAGAGRHVVWIGETAYNVADAGDADANGVAIAAAINAGTQASATATAGSATTDKVTITLKPCTVASIMVMSTVDDSTWIEIASGITLESGDTNEVKYRVDGAVTAGATYTLDQPYQGETGYFYEGTTAATNTGVATVTNYGIKMTGIQADFDVTSFRDYYVNRFTPTFSNEDTLVTLIQGALSGSGMWQQAAMDEYMTWGYEGQNEMISVPPKARENAITQCAEYSVVNIAWTEDIDGLVSKSGGAGNVLIYCQLSADGTMVATANASAEVADVIGEIASPTFASTDLAK